MTDDLLIDLDARKAERAEKASDGPSPRVKLGGNVYELPRVLPATFMFNLGAIQRNDFSRLEPMVKQVFGDKFDEVMPLMDIEDLGAFMEELPKKYNTSAGESSGSLTT